MTEPGNNLERGYRKLAREEPPAEIDQAILLAARRAVNSRPRRQWAAPLSIAAVLVLGIGVSLRMQMETSDDSAPPARAPAAPVSAPPSPATQAPAPPSFAPQSRVAPLRAPQSVESSAMERRDAAASVPDPMAELERIAKLRDEGREEVADRALEEFVRSHPGFAIPDSIRQRVKRR